MNIACDARSLVGHHTGVGTWVTQVMGGLAKDFRHSITLTASRTITIPEGLKQDRVRALPPMRLAIPGTLWLHTVLPAWLAATRPDIFVGSLAVLPRRCPVPTVAMVHDITPRTHPEHHTLANRFCFNAYLEESLERADVIVTGSAATEQVLLDQFPFCQSKLEKIGYGTDEYFSPPGPDDDGHDIRRKLTGGRPYLLHLGTIEPRKGVADLVAAWEELHSLHPEPPDLVIAGGLGWDTAPIVARIHASPRRDRIHVPGYVEPDTARNLLRHAEIFVIASEAEGFGLPLAEAISCGTPCIASDIPPLRENGGDAALYAPPGNPQVLARTLNRALDPETTADLRRRAALRAPELRWGPVVAAWNDLLGDVVRVRLAAGSTQ